MEKIMVAEIAQAIQNKEIEEIVTRFISNGTSSLFRMHAAIHIGNNLDQLGYSEYSGILLKEMNNDVHFERIRPGIKSAWTIAIVLAENLKEKDYPKLREEFNKWDQEEREFFLAWLKDHPEHIKILTGEK